jgi:4-carboxymuconolactone decarboxylase
VAAGKHGGWVFSPGVTTSPDNAPRIAPASPEGNPEELQSLLDSLGRPPRPAANLFLTLARHPALLRDWLPLGSRLLLGGTLPPRDRELAILRTAWLCGCDYEWGHHVRIGARAGLSRDEVADVRDPTAARWRGHDGAVLRGTGELVAGHTLSQATWDALAETYDDAALVEFTMLVGHYVMLAGLLNAARVARDAGTGEMPPGPGRP